MSYRLQKPITDKQKADFIVEYNHNQGMVIQDGTDTYNADELTFMSEFIFALEPNEIMSEVEAEIDVPDYETVQEEIVDPETGEVIIIEKQVPVMVDKEIEVPDYDDEGNIIGYHTEIIQVQSYHKETVILYKPIVDPDYEEKQAEKEAIRIANLHMTRGDVFRGLLLAKGVTRADMRGLIEAMPEQTPEQRIAKEYALIDFDEALEFYRGVALIDTVGVQLGISKTQMDRFFDTKDWHELLEASDENTTD